MEEEYSEHEKEVMQQFYAICKKVIHDTRVDCLRKLSKAETRVIVGTELTMRELNQLATNDEYLTDMEIFHVLGFDIGIKDDTLCQALEHLTGYKRDVVLLFYHMDMSDAEIARMMNKAKSTIVHQRVSSLQRLREIMEELADGESGTS